MFGTFNKRKGLSYKRNSKEFSNKYYNCILQKNMISLKKGSTTKKHIHAHTIFYVTTSINILSFCILRYIIKHCLWPFP